MIVELISVSAFLELFLGLVTNLASLVTVDARSFIYLHCKLLITSVADAERALDGILIEENATTSQRGEICQRQRSDSMPTSRVAPNMNLKAANCLFNDGY